MSRSRSSSSEGSVESDADGDGSDRTQGQELRLKTEFDDTVDIDGIDPMVDDDINGIVGSTRRIRAEKAATWSGSEGGHG
jgi:hypothetical protein